MVDLKPEDIAAYDYVADLVKRGKYDYPAENACGWGYLWHGHALRDAFRAGATYAREHPLSGDESSHG